MLVLGFGFASFQFAQPVSASDAFETNLKADFQTAGGQGYDTTGTLPQFIGGIVKVVLGVLGMVLLIITVYAGMLYMTAAGDDTKVKKAKAMLGQTVIGLIIVVGAYALTDFVMDRMIEAVDSTPSDLK